MSDFVQSLVPALGHALVQFTWQGLVIGVLVAVALRVARDARPQTRYAIACLGMLACVVVPLAGVLSNFGDGSAIAVAARDALPVQRVDAADVVVASAWSPLRLDAQLPLIVALWAAGASVFCLRTLIGIAWVGRMRALPQPPLQKQWQATLDTLASRFGLNGVALRLVDALDSPVTAGWFRPMVLLPVSVALHLPSTYVEALLAHELAHVRRHDYLVNLLQRAVEALLFFHPVTWWLSRRVRIERELIADQLAAEAIADPPRLARAHAALSELAPPSPVVPHLAHAAHGGHLMSRIQQLVRSERRPPAGRIALPLLGVAAACIAFYAQAQIARDAAEPAQPAPAAQAAPAAKPAPAPKADEAVHMKRIRTDDDDHFAWALVRKNEKGYSMSGDTSDMDDIESAKRSLRNDFIWFRRDGKAFVIDDPSTVSRAQAAWKDSDAMGERMSALGAQMEVHGKKMEEYGRQMEQLAKVQAPSPEMEAAHENVMALAERQQALAGKQQLLAMKQRKAAGADQAQYEKEMEALSEEMEKLGEEMEAHHALIEKETAELHRNAVPMEALGKQMEEASKPMEKLGDQMGELGRQQEKLVRQAERELDALIDEATRKGLAKPAPGRG